MVQVKIYLRWKSVNIHPDEPGTFHQVACTDKDGTYVREAFWTGTDWNCSVDTESPLDDPPYAWTELDILPPSPWLFPAKA